MKWTDINELAIELSDKYPETDYELIQEAGVKIEILNKKIIADWAKKLTVND